jgi:gliding motility-associated-like protein
MKNIFKFLFLFFSITTFSQFSKIHYIPPVSHSDAQEPQGQYMYISCPSTSPINFQIKAIGGTTIQGTVTRDNPYVLVVGFGGNTQMMIDRNNVNQIMTNKGYIIEAEDLVYVTVRMTSTPLNYQAGSIVSKGRAALGRQFRIGAFENIFAPSTNSNHYTFATILATENNTTISFGSIKTGVSLINNSAAGNNPANIVLNQGQSFAMAVEGPNTANKNGLIGASITSDKDIVVNCGSFAGSNSATSNLDLGMDQIVSAERTGTQYIFIRGNGINDTERPMIIADQDGTEVKINGSSAPIITLNAGEYKSFSGADFSLNNNLFIETSKPAFAYQALGGTNDPANQNMHFVPPLSCGTPKIINNIPLINEIGNLNNFTGTVCIVAETGATLNFIVNGTNYSLASLPTSVTVSGPLSVSGNSQFVTYTFSGLTGNISVFSSSQVYLSYYASSGAATYGGFYSGFTFEPEITFNELTATQSGCIPNVNLEVNALSSFDNFQWFQNQIAISGATFPSYTPTTPGYYFVEGKITACGVLQTPYSSVEIPVSDCPIDNDNDGINNNIDQDLDNDGISNCQESYGNIGINLNSSATTGNVIVGTYINNFSTNLSNVVTSSGSYSFNSTSSGNIISGIPSGKTSAQTFKVTFANPINIGLQYVTTANVADLLNSNAELIVKVDINKTITVLNPDNQLLIDTNYDGIFESGVTNFSSFEIRFRLKSSTPLAAGTGTFKFLASQISNISIIHKNLSETNSNNATFNLFATCVPKDADNDGISDQNDLDSDNDGITDFIENLGTFYAANATTTFADANSNGIYDFFEGIFLTSDFDLDGVPDYLDLDSDNDGIYDLIESGSNALDSNNNGIVDGNNASFGTNGLSNNLQVPANSGLLNYLIANTDGIGMNNFVSLDSDNDGCNDVIEAGFNDPNNDGFIGSIPISVNANGLVLSAIPYQNSINQNYVIAAPIIINAQPIDANICNLQNATFSISTNAVNSYQWQISIDNGLTFNNIVNNTVYSGANTNTLLITNVQSSFDNYKYRVILNKNGNSCGKISVDAKLKILALPVLTSPVSLIQCDNDFDGISNFNLNEKNTYISANANLETFTFFRTQAGAIANSIDPSILILNPTIFNTGTNSVWVRVTNANGCFSVARINLTVSIPPISLVNYTKIIDVCDDFLDINGNNNANNNDIDGIATFDLSPVVSEIENLLTNPSNYRIKFYKNANDALQEFDASGNSLAITNITSYRNIGYPNQQKLWVRVENSTNNDCFGFGEYVTLNVKALPKIKLTDEYQVCLNLPNVKIKLTARILDGSSESNYTYIWKKDGVVLSNILSTLDISEKGIYTVQVINLFGCSRLRTVTVTASVIAFLLPPTIVELTENDSVTINVTGIGNYEYSIDNISGPYQNSSYFENIASGIHDFYIKDTNKCGIVKQTVAVLGAPKYFTPNDDGINDFWNIKGINTLEYKNAIIYIYDRFGRLLAQINPNSLGWNGKFNGENIIADDYWFTLQLEDGRNAKGHFSLKR